MALGLGISVCLTQPALGRVWRVSPNGVGDAPTIQAGLDSASAGDTVLLAPGTFSWANQGATSPSMLRSRRSIILRGEAGHANTILDAQWRGRLLECTDVGTNFEITDITFLNGFAPVEVVPGPELETQRNGVVPLAYESHGGAIDARGASAPIVRRCVFKNNVATGQAARGGAIYCNDATIEDCEFVSNRAGVSGGTNGRGGAVWCGNAIITHCNFSSNWAWGYEAASGGAVRSASAVFTACTFTENHAECPGGPSGGAVAAVGAPRFEGCDFVNNSAVAHYFFASGGALAAGSGVVVDCRFVGNSALCEQGPGQGGGLAGSEVTIERCVFAGNRAVRTDPLGPGRGGAIHAVFLSRVENCTLVGNSGGTETGVAGIDLEEGGTVHATLLAWNSPGLPCAGDAAVWSCNDLIGNAGGDRVCGVDSGNNFSADPGFCSSNPELGDISLHSDSPCAAGHVPEVGCESVGAGSVGCGPQAVQARSWSATKNLYRSLPSGVPAGGR